MRQTKPLFVQRGLGDQGTEQFWREEGVEPILMLRALWISQDDRWPKYWANRPAYVN